MLHQSRAVTTAPCMDCVGQASACLVSIFGAPAKVKRRQAEACPTYLRRNVFPAAARITETACAAHRSSRRAYSWPFIRRRVRDVSLAHASAHLVDRLVLVLFHPADHARTHLSTWSTPFSSSADVIMATRAPTTNTKHARTIFFQRRRLSAAPCDTPGTPCPFPTRSGTRCFRKTLPAKDAATI